MKILVCSPPSTRRTHSTAKHIQDQRELDYVIHIKNIAIPSCGNRKDNILIASRRTAAFIGTPYVCLSFFLITVGLLMAGRAKYYTQFFIRYFRVAA